MINVRDVTPEVYRIAEGSMNKQVQRFQSFGWWRAGHNSGTLPSRWELVQYGREVTLGWYLEGDGIDLAVLKGIKAIYELAYGDVRDSIVWQDGDLQCVSATSDVELSITEPTEDDTINFHFLDMVGRAALTPIQKRLVTLYAFGWNKSEATRHLGISRATGYRRFAEALEVLREELTDVSD